MRDYIEVSLEIKPFIPGGDVAMVQLAELGFESFSENQGVLQAYVPKDEFDGDKLRNWVNKFREAHAVSYSMQTIPGQNWNATWESQYESVFIGGKRLHIRAPFHQPSQEAEIDMIIDPQMSFGTGHHPTTALLCEALLDNTPKGKSVLDFGSGTGVLAILAGRLGASKILAVDIEENAVENTRHNIGLNPAVEIDVEKGNATSIVGQQYELILANINKNILLQDLPVFNEVLLPGGDLFLSGFFSSDADAFRKNKTLANWQELPSYEKEDWMVLHFRKPDHL